MSEKLPISAPFREEPDELLHLVEDDVVRGGLAEAEVPERLHGEAPLLTPLLPVREHDAAVLLLVGRAAARGRREQRRHHLLQRPRPPGEPRVLEGAVRLVGREGSEISGVSECMRMCTSMT